jgi:ABC-type Zn2+ transport system substrate-binding protein/surface adhesin
MRGVSNRPETCLLSWDSTLFDDDDDDDDEEEEDDDEDDDNDEDEAGDEVDVEADVMTDGTDSYDTELFNPDMRVWVNRGVDV